MTWDPPTITLVIGSTVSGLVTIIGTVFAGLAMLRAGKAVDAAGQAKDKANEVVGAVADVKTQTNGTMARLTEQNRVLVEKLETITQSQLAALSTSHQVALARVQSLEAEVVKRADAMPPPQSAPGDPSTAVDLAKINDTLEHERRNRKAASAGIQAAIEDLNQRLHALQQPEPNDPIVTGSKPPEISQTPESRTA